MPKAKKQVARKSKKRVKSRAVSGDDSLVLGHYKMLADPCASELRPSVYRGRAGYIMRVSTVNTVDTPAGTSGFAAWHPGAGNVSLKTGVATSTVFTNTWGPTSGTMAAPVGILPTISTAVRCVAACMTVTYVGSELNRGGAVAVIAGPANEVLTPTPTTVGAKFDQATAVERTPTKTFEIRWTPSPQDEEYVDLSAAPSDYFGDRSALMFAFVTGETPLYFRVRMTAIYEYLPKSGTNMPLPTASNHTVVGGIERLVNVAARTDKFVTNLLTTAGRAYDAYQAVTNSNTFRLASQAAPLLLGM